MTSVSKSNEIVFVKNYYSTLCNRPATIRQYYMKGSQLSMGREQDKPEICTEDFGRHIKSKMAKSLSKVLISHLSYQKIDDTKSLINVIGQFVYSNTTQERISHQFVVTRADSVMYIKNEILTFLDEEIIYETERSSKKTILLSYAKGKLSEVVEFVSEFGEIVSIESRENCKLSVTFSNIDGVDNIKKNMAKVNARGYDLDLDESKND